MKISKATKEEVKAIRSSKYKQVFDAIDEAEFGEYIKISELPSGKTCATTGKYLRNEYYMRAIRLSIKMDSANKTIYVAKKLDGDE